MTDADELRERIRTAVNEYRADYSVSRADCQAHLNGADFDRLHRVRGDLTVETTHREYLRCGIRQSWHVAEGDVVVLHDDVEEQYASVVPEEVFGRLFRPRIERTLDKSQDTFTLVVEFDALRHVEREWFDAAEDEGVMRFPKIPPEASTDRRTRVAKTFIHHWDTGMVDLDKARMIEERVARSFHAEINESIGGTITVPVTGYRDVRRPAETEPAVAMEPDAVTEPLMSEVERETVVVAEDTYEVGDVWLPASPEESGW